MKAVTVAPLPEASPPPPQSTSQETLGPSNAVSWTHRL